MRLNGPALSSEPARVAMIDGLRGVLALVVVAWHVTPEGGAWLLALANFAVGLFFVLSGYVLTRSWDGRVSVFLMRRFVRLWPVYALCLGAGYLIAGARPMWSEFFWYPLIDPNSQPLINPPIWSLCIEVWAMPFMPAIVWAGTGGVWRVALCMLGLMMTSLAAPQVGIGALFVAGAFLSRAEIRSRLLESAFPQVLGRISYSLYLSHWPVVAVAKRVLGPWGGVMALPLVFAIAVAVWWAVERPSIQASRRVARTVDRWLDSMRRTVHDA